MSIANSGSEKSFLERWPPINSLVGSWSTRYTGEGIYLQNLVNRVLQDHSCLHGCSLNSFLARSLCDSWSRGGGVNRALR